MLAEELQDELGLPSISAAQLSRKHNKVPSTLLADIFQDLISQVYQRSSSSPTSRKSIKIIDSTTITLCQQTYKWAEYRKDKSGVKMHLRLAFAAPEETTPDKLTFTSANRHDRTQMDDLIDESGVTYIIDRGYTHYEKYDEYCDRGIYFVTRLKDNAVIDLLDTTLLEHKHIFADSKVIVGAAKKKMKHVLRLVEVKDTQGNELRILTNRWDLSAEEISDMYRSRWQIELFFKWIKQHLKVKKFYGTSENAVWNQLYLALIAYCLLLLVKMETNSVHDLFQVMRWLRVYLWKNSRAWVAKLVSTPQSRITERRKREE